MPSIDAPAGERLAKVSTQLLRAISRIRYLRLRSELLEEGNPEINSDQVALGGRLDRLNLGADLRDALHAIDRKARLAVDPTDFQSCMTLSRSFLDNFIERATTIVEAKTGQPVPTLDRPSFHAQCKYLRQADVITDKEHEVLRTLYGYASTEGAHALGSGPEQVRVMKNTVIEWTLMISGRLEKLRST